MIDGRLVVTGSVLVVVTGLVTFMTRLVLVAVVFVGPLRGYLVFSGSQIIGKSRRFLGCAIGVRFICFSHSIK